MDEVENTQEVVGPATSSEFNAGAEGAQTSSEEDDLQDDIPDIEVICPQHVILGDC